ncbi:MAG: hypothetical protein A2X64_06895 [Ignavibacteria bacterium GWF2_33_9]|nr:MAG: hypothetical protein A2X64_06895 [Ignavibacteria bacterium GWF2_33_9]
MVNRAFTTLYNRVISEIITDAHVTYPLKENEELNPNILFACKALWDTGATHSVIREGFANDHHFVPTGQTKVNGVGGEHTCNTYLVSIGLPNKVMIPNIRVTECKDTIPNKFDIIIGMDIISRCDFTITNKNNVSKLSVLMPSIHDTDYVKELEVINKQKMKNIGRNELCPCGSGNKYKNCHGKN